VQVYVHPVPPVLNETRAMVLAYNSVYKERVEQMKGECNGVY